MENLDAWKSHPYTFTKCVSAYLNLSSPSHSSAPWTSVREVYHDLMGLHLSNRGRDTFFKALRLKHLAT